jgi:transglutaminase superfamily protein
MVGLDKGLHPTRWGAIVVCVISLTAAGLIGWLAQSEVLLVTNEHNGEFPASSHILQEDDFHHPRLRLLRTREKLDEVVSTAKTQFEKIVLLRAWAHRQWRIGTTFYYPPWDAVEILDLARKHRNRGFCAQYAVVLLQACQSMGIHARYVDLPGHFVVAVWSDDFNRWVVMDPTNDLHYERDGVPLGGGELYRTYWTADVHGIVRVDSQGGRLTVTRDDLAHYRLYSIGLRANQLSEPVEVRSNGVWRKLVPVSDYTTYPKVGRDRLEITNEFLAWRSKDAEVSFPNRPETRDRDEFRNALNQTIIFLANERMTERILKVALLSNNSPTFERFLIRSDESTAWIPTPSPTFKWLLHPGMNELYARIETRDGWTANVSSMRMFYKPPLIEFLPSFRGNVFRFTWHRSG